MMICETFGAEMAKNDAQFGPAPRPAPSVFSRPFRELGPIHVERCI